MRLAWLGAVVVVLSSSACDRGGGTPNTGRIGAILMQQDQFFRLNEHGMKAAAERLGVDLRVQNASAALDKEISLIETFIAQRVGAILVSPLSSQASIPALRRAAQAGIRVVTYNNAVSDDTVACAIASDQASLGAMSGRAARDFIERRLGGKARVALIGFTSQLPEQGGARVAGVKAELAALPGVTIVAEQDAWLAPQAATVVGELLGKNPDVIWAANEGGTVGAYTAVRNAGRQGKVAVFGTDVSVQIVDALLSPDEVLQAVTAQMPFEMGQAAVESAAKLLRGEAVEKRQTLGGVLFTREKPEALRACRQQLLDAAG